MFHRGSGGGLVLRLLAAEKEPGVQLPIDVLLFDKRTSPYSPPPFLPPSTPLSLLLFCLPSLRRSMCAGRLLFVLPCRKKNVGGASLPSLGLLHRHGWLPARVLTFDPLKLSHPISHPTTPHFAVQERLQAVTLRMWIFGWLAIGF